MEVGEGGMGTEGDFAWGCKCTMRCAHVVLLSCTLETHMVLRTNVHPIHSIKKGDVVHIYNVILFSHNNEILPSATIWVNLEHIMLSEIGHKKNNENHIISLLRGM